jgi:O-antigen ligase
LSVPALLSYYVTLFLFSRSGYAAIAATGIFWGILKSRKVLILLIIVFLSYETLLPNAVKERIEMTKTEDGYDDTAQERFEMWKIGLGILQGNPILGAGFEFTHNFNINLEGHGTRTWHSFHNSYLQQAVETGIVGLGIYLFLFFLAVKLGWQLYNKTENGFQKGLGTGLMGATFACLAGNLAGSYWNFLNVMGYYWVLLALVIRCILNIEEQEKVPVPSIENQTDLKVKDKALKRPQRSKFNLKYL